MSLPLTQSQADALVLLLKKAAGLDVALPADIDSPDQWIGELAKTVGPRYRELIDNYQERTKPPV